jgi:hypothetical protein
MLLRKKNKDGTQKSVILKKTTRQVHFSSGKSTSCLQNQQPNSVVFELASLLLFETTNAVLGKSNFFPSLLLFFAVKSRKEKV